MEESRSQLINLVVSIHEHLSRGNRFDASYLVDGMDSLTRSVDRNQKMILPPDFWVKANDILVQLFQEGQDPEMGLKMLKGLARCGLMPQVQNALNGAFGALSLHYLKADYSPDQADRFIQFINTLMDYGKKVLGYPRMIHLLAMGKALDSISDGARLDRDKLREQVSSNNRFVEDIGAIINPLSMSLSGESDDQGASLVNVKLAEPLYALLHEMATFKGVIDSRHFLENLHWLCITRVSVAEYQTSHPVSLCNPIKLGNLACSLLKEGFTPLMRSIGDPLAPEQEAILEKMRDVTGMVRSSGHEASSAALTSIFCALLASRHTFIDPYYGEPDPDLVEMVGKLFHEIDLPAAERILKRQHGIKLSLYIKTYQQENLGRLSSRSRDDLFSHDLGL